MRSISRHTARLTSCQSLRASSRPRSPCIPQRRAFQSSATRSSEPKPPNGGPESNRSLEEQREYEKKLAEEAIRPEHVTSPWDNGEPRRPALRRTMRQRRMAEPEVPKPPPLPDWFLKQNVKLVADAPKECNGKEVRQLRCVDRETGHTLFSVPHYSAKRTKEPKKAKASAQEEEQLWSSGKIPGIGTFTTNVKRLDRQSPTVVTITQDTDLGFKFEPHIKHDGMEYDPLTWTLLETEAQARAAMSMSGAAGVSIMHAASRSDIHLHCPDTNAHYQLDEHVRHIAALLQADLIRLDANDIADLTADYVGESKDSPGSFSTLAYEAFDGTVASGLKIRETRPHGLSFDNPPKDEMDEEEEDVDESNQSSTDLGTFRSFEELQKALSDRRGALGKMMGGMGGIHGVSVIPVGIGMGQFPANRFSTSKPKADSSADFVSWDDARLGVLLDSLLDAPMAKRSATASAGRETSEEARVDSTAIKSDHGRAWNARAADAIVNLLETIGRSGERSMLPFKFKGGEDIATGADQKTSDRRRTIVHVRDLKAIMSSRLGETIIQRLVRSVQKRRQVGDEVLIIGTTAQSVDGPIESLLDTHEDSPFRLTIVPPLFDMDDAERNAYRSHAPYVPTRAMYDDPSYDRIAEINLRHIRSMLSRLGQPSLDVEKCGETLRSLRVPGTHVLSEKVLGQDGIQRMILTALGLARSYARAGSVQPVHIALATATLSRADHATHSWMAWQERQQSRSSRPLPSGKPKTPAQSKIDSLKSSSNPHETRLLTGVVDPQNIKTGFADVHATPDTIEALKSLTTLSLQRPDAFKYGVLANDRLTGLLLYGPPGTGKTLLAKAVAKESSATVLEVSGAQIYEKYVGEGEKMVRAVFSLAKKLSPCIVFIDEADAIFGSRSGAGNRNTHREIINQFLREWDGMDDNSVFMMVASNRPFDLDDAVLRRLPRRLLVDLPVAKDRESILGIHLRNETLSPSISLSQLAEQTPLYSGSDLKNLCVSAALAAVREENDALAGHNALVADGKPSDFKLPERRVLEQKHFDKAVQEISASISEDMGSLTAIRKFDEQYGDRRGRRKKSGYGFGLGGGRVDESAVRVR